MQKLTAESPELLHGPRGPRPTADKAVGDIDLNALQATEDGAIEQIKQRIKLSALEGLDSLSGLRVHLDAINFTSSKPHAYGGKAEVAKATLKRGDGSDEQPVAVKKLRYNDDVNKRGFCNEFVNEVEIMAQLCHENIIRLVGFVEDLHNGKAWFVLSWEPNGNVSEFLAAGEWEIPERISLIKDTFAGVEYLHTRQPPICHGDLKSLNVLVNTSYRAIITDFGSARVLVEPEEQGRRDKVPDVQGSSVIASVRGEQIDHTRITIVASSNQLTLTGPAWSLRWVAPEVAMGQPQNLASDIWAAGWICWEMMKNKVPFPELNSEGAITLKVIQGQVPVAHEDTQLSQIVRLCSLMMDCWLFNPESRPNISRCNNEIRRMPSVPPLGGRTSDSNGPSAELLLQMGRIHLSQGGIKKATPLFQQVLSTAMSAGDQTTSAEALVRLGRTCFLTSNYAEAGQYFAQAQAIYTSISADSGRAGTFYWLAKVSHAQSKLDQAEGLYIEARIIYLRIGNEEGQANTLHGLGNLFHDRSQYLKAEEFYNLARDIFGRLGHYGGQANTLRRLGKLFLDRSEYTKAEESFTQALDIYSRVGDNVGRANVKYNLGHLHLVQGHNTQAVPLLAEAKIIYSQIGKSKMERNCSRWLDVASKQGDSPTTSLPVYVAAIVSSLDHQHPLSTQTAPEPFLMETFATELLKSVPNVNERIPFCKPLSLTISENTKKADSAGAQGTQGDAAEQSKLKTNSLRDRLASLLSFRIHTGAIEFTSAQPRRCGGKAEVVKATFRQGNGSDEQDVAVKKLRYCGDTNDRKFGTEFVHEVEMMAQLSHKNIVRLIGFVEDLEEGKAWIILSWEPNGNVSEFVASGDWEIPERISLIKDTFEGLEYLHTRQPPICHGDLKSLNILVNASYRAIITDFGSARILRETEDRKDSEREKVSNSTGAPTEEEGIRNTKITVTASDNQLTLTGPAWSLRWAAPEVAFGEPQSLASDIWAAGWICWEIMTNKVPFPELNSEGAITLKVVQGKVPIAHEDMQLSQVIRLCSLMTDCWVFTPGDRPNIARCHSEVKKLPSIPPFTGRTSDTNAPSAELLCQMGRIHRSQGNYQKAISQFQQALSIAVSEGDHKIHRRALAGLGGAYYLMSNFTQAEKYFTQAKDICAQTGTDKDQAAATFWLANVYRSQSKLTEAEEFYTQARDLYLRTGNEHGQANTLYGLACTFHERSHYAQAEEFCNQALPIYTRLGDDRGQANTLQRLGMLCYTRSEYTRAEELFKKALDIYSRIGDNPGRASSLLELGQMYRAQILNTKAAPLFAEARSIYSQIGDSEREEYCSRWLGVILEQGDSSTESPPVPGVDSIPYPNHQQ